LQIQSARSETIGLYKVRHATKSTSTIEQKHTAISRCNNAARGLMWGKEIPTRFLCATNAGPCVTRELHRNSHGNHLVGYKGVVGNEEVNDVARKASNQEGRLIALARERVREVGGVIQLINRDRSENPTPVQHHKAAGLIYVDDR
jgi:hypothetical protein